MKELIGFEAKGSFADGSERLVTVTWKDGSPITPEKMQMAVETLTYDHEAKLAEIHSMWAEAMPGVPFPVIE